METSTATASTSRTKRTIFATSAAGMLLSTLALVFPAPASADLGAGGVPGCTNNMPPIQAHCRKTVACDPSNEVCVSYDITSL